MVRVVVVVVAVWVAGCLTPGAVVCGDKTCPAETTCDEVGGYCLTQAQTTACTGIPDGKPCDAAGTPGICIRSFCEPGCGDGVTDPSEQCDDANFASHDGCSSSCQVEVPTWIEQVPAWRGLTQQVAVYHEALGQIVMVGGLDSDGLSDAIWQYNPKNAGTVNGGWKNVTAAFAPNERPSARSSAQIAYDSTRNVLVLNGGIGAGGLIGDTWEYAASTRTFEGELVGTWTLTSSGPTPIPRSNAAMTFDAGLGKVVMYGGLQNAVPDKDTWLYDGTWKNVNTALDPNVAPRASMAYDPIRDTTVMFGGQASSTFEFDGANWTKLDPSPSPPARRGGMMTYDPVRQKIVVFGGLVGPSLDTVASDTWAYNGTWQEVNGSQNPPGRQAAVLVADPVNGRLIMAGGNVAEDPPFDDVWELSSTGWTVRTVRFEPPPANGAAGAYSLDDGALVVLGGSSSTSPSNFEMWRHDGRAWQQLANAPVDRYSQGFIYDPDHHRFVMTGGRCGSTTTTDCLPPQQLANWPSDTYALDQMTRQWSKLPATWEPRLARSNFLMLYDEAAREMVVYGGFNANGGTATILTDTWVSDGTTWTELTTTEHPAMGPAGVSPLAAYDPSRGAVVLFDVERVTWELRDHQWVRIIDALAPDAAGPSTRMGGAMVYDPFRKRLVMMGGTDMEAHRLFDIWELDPGTLAWTQVFVTGASPLPRNAFVLAAHANARALLLYGGAGGTGFARNDTWQLKYVSTSPEEDCTNVDDDDGDMQIDSEDPDCEPPPP